MADGTWKVPATVVGGYCRDGNADFHMLPRMLDSRSGKSKAVNWGWEGDDLE